jgi:CRP-like cAMP-binding protein
MENRLLACLAARQFAQLAPHLKQVSLLHGAILHEPDTQVEWVYFPMSGAVSLLAVMKGGQEIEIASIGREGAVGLSARSGPCRARTRALVQVAGVAKAIPSPVIRLAIARDEFIRDVMIRYKSTLSAQTQQIAACNALHSVEHRLARWLLQMSDRIESIEFPVTQHTLSCMLGVRRTTVTLVAHKLQQDGIIHYRRGHLVIVNPGALRALACECYDACKGMDQEPGVALRASA